MDLIIPALLWRSIPQNGSDMLQIVIQTPTPPDTPRMLQLSRRKNYSPAHARHMPLEPKRAKSHHLATPGVSIWDLPASILEPGGSIWDLQGSVFHLRGSITFRPYLGRPGAWRCFGSISRTLFRGYDQIDCERHQKRCSETPIPGHDNQIRNERHQKSEVLWGALGSVLGCFGMLCI